MDVAAPVPPAPVPASSRLGLRGDISWRLLRAAVRGCPWYLERTLIFCWAGMIGLLAHEPRRALARNLRALGIRFPNFTAWRAFQEFGAVTVDSLRAQQNPNVLQWEVEGREHLETAQRLGGPVVVWTAHMGSYDAAAAFFAHRIGARLHAVRKPEQNAEMQAIRERDLRSHENEHFVTIYNKGEEESLGVELLRVLKRGNWVALQADRSLPGLSTFHAEHDGCEWTLPRGPFFLPMVAQAICLPVFIRRTGSRQYLVTFHPPLTPPVTRERTAAVQCLVKAWLPLLQQAILAHPDQWFVFEHFVKARTPASHES